jgi:hypothetical protein
MTEFLFKTRAGEVPASQMTAEDLDWYANKCQSVAMRKAAAAEIERRDAAPAAQQPVHRGEIVPAPQLALTTGAFRDPERATDALRVASALGHLVAPAPICGSLPEGCAMSIAAVHIDAKTETYPINGKQGLSKVALDKISGAAGISWVTRDTKRLDNGSDPRYCHYRAVGRVRDFDGTVRALSGEVEIDARDGSPLIDEIITKAKAAKRDPMPQIIELRKFLLRHAESKAKNRAIRSLGVRTAYTQAELAKPFVVAKVQFTGETNDPELRKIFSAKIADSFLGAEAALYGEPLSNPALPAGDGSHAAPPVGSVPADDAAAETTGEDDDMPPARAANTTVSQVVNADKF